MARVLYLSQYFVSADQPGGVRHWQHARALVRAGHEVSVVTSYVQHKERTIPERYRGRRIVREREDGLDVWRTYATPGYGRDARSRIANYGSFAGVGAGRRHARAPPGRGRRLVAAPAGRRRRAPPWPAAGARDSCSRCATSGPSRRSRPAW